MMSPRERFYRVTSHPPKWPDRICNEFIGGSGAVSILDEEPYGLKALADYINIPDYSYPYPAPRLGYTHIDERILNKFNCDFRYIPPIDKEKKGTSSLEFLPNGYARGSYGTLWKPSYGVSRQGIPRMMIVPENEQPAAQLNTLEDIDNYPYWPDTSSSKARTKMEEVAAKAGKIVKKLHEGTDYVITNLHSAEFDTNPYSTESHRIVRGLFSWSKDIRNNPEFYHAFAERMLQHGVDKTEIILNAIGDYMDCIYAGPGDLGTQRGPMISIEDFREFVTPYQKKAINLIKKYTKAKIRAHMCGSIHLYIKDLAELGIDIVGQQINPNTHHMEPERLKRDYGNLITLWGGIDTQIVLVRYTPEKREEWVKRCIYALAPGHIVASNHAIQNDVPPENIWSAYKAIKKYSEIVYGA